MRLSRIIPLLALVVGLAACGSGDENPRVEGGAGDAPVGGDFAVQANAICVQAKEQIVAIQERTPDESEDLRGGLEQLGAVLQETSDRLADLERPDGDAGKAAERWVEDFARRTEQAPELIDPIVSAVEAQDTEAVEQATQRLNALGAQGETADLARRLGATECAA